MAVCIARTWKNSFPLLSLPYLQSTRSIHPLREERHLRSRDAALARGLMNIARIFV